VPYDGSLTGVGAVVKVLSLSRDLRHLELL